MTQTIQKKLNDSAVIRWTALILVALMQFFAYMFVDVLSPLQTMLQTSRSWSPTVFGLYGGSEFILNVCGFLILAGIILDKMGVRFTGILSASMMVLGAAIKLYGISDYFCAGGFGYDFFSSFLTDIPASAKIACLGFMIFGCGTEMGGVTVSRAIVKWFTGKELALAMGAEMAIARLGVFAVFSLSPWVANLGTPSVVRPVAVVGLLLCIGLLSYIIFSVMDRKLDRQSDASDLAAESEEPFKVADLKNLFTSKTFLIVSALCVLYYSAIFPFQKFATGMLESNLGIPNEQAANIFRWFPMGAMILTPFLGMFLDHKGKGATMLMIGAVLMFVCHMIFAVVPLTPVIAFAAIVLLGLSFSLVPAALWPSVPKLIDNRYLGSAYAVIFWIQNIGLMIFPILIGATLNATNPGISSNVEKLQQNLTVISEQKVVLDEFRTTITPEEGELTTMPDANQLVLQQRTAKYLDLFNATQQAIDEAVEDNQLWLDESSRKMVITSLVGQVKELKTITNRIPLQGVGPMMQSLDKIEENLMQIAAIRGNINYNYTAPMLVFACLGVLAFLLGMWLKVEDRKKHYGLELPNIQK